MKKSIPQTVAYWLPANSALIDCFTDHRDFYTFINVADYADDMLQPLCQLIPNVLLIEPDPGCHERSVELIRCVRRWPKLPVKCVVLLPSDVLWRNAFDELDISGTLCLDHAKDELIGCLNMIADGYRFLSPHLHKRVDNTTTGCSSKTVGVLTSREYEIVELIAAGYTNKEIAERLFISVKTVETHKLNVIHKLRLSSTCELRQWVRQQKVRG